MADTLPPSNLNPGALPWGRGVERLLGDLLTRLGALEDRAGGTRTTAIQALRRLGADPAIYRHDGVLAPRDQSEFALAMSEGGTDDEAGAVASFNLNSDRALLRATAADLRTGYAAFHAGLIELGFGQGLRYAAFRDEYQMVLTAVLDQNQRPYVQIARDNRAAVLTAGFETDGTDRPYLEFFGDDEHRIYSFADLGETVPPASEATPGKVALASDQETTTGSNASKATTPHGVHAAILAAVKAPLDYWRGDWSAA